MDLAVLVVLDLVVLACVVGVFVVRARRATAPNSYQLWCEHITEQSPHAHALVEVSKGGAKIVYASDKWESLVGKGVVPRGLGTLVRTALGSNRPGTTAQMEGWDRVNVAPFAPGQASVTLIRREFIDSTILYALDDLTAALEGATGAHKAIASEPPDEH